MGLLWVRESLAPLITFLQKRNNLSRKLVIAHTGDRETANENSVKKTKSKFAIFKRRKEHKNTGAQLGKE